MSQDKTPSIIVKRVKKVSHGHHGGAWKIAYADFVTAMMAFFLLMWLLSALNKYQLQGISEYFKTPLSEVFSDNKKTGKLKAVMPGGGDSVIQHPGEKQTGEAAHPKPPTTLVEQTEKEKAQELKQLQDLKKSLEEKIKTDPELKKFKSQLTVDMTDDGLRVQLRDVENKPMFATGSSEPYPEVIGVLAWLAKELNHVPNNIIISGHTDSAPFARDEKGYGNWELSVDRANATRRELVAGGLDAAKILRVSGHAETDPLDKKDTLNPINRRISIILLKKEGEKRAKEQN